jgi:hypothetical protein
VPTSRFAINISIAILAAIYNLDKYFACWKYRQCSLHCVNLWLLAVCTVPGLTHKADEDCLSVKVEQTAGHCLALCGHQSSGSGSPDSFCRKCLHSLKPNIYQLGSVYVVTHGYQKSGPGQLPPNNNFDSSWPYTQGR